jgi:hypothetical protein
MKIVTIEAVFSPTHSASRAGAKALPFAQRSLPLLAISFSSPG